MTNTKAQVGDLIRIVNVDDTRYENGDIFEVVNTDSESVYVKTDSGWNLCVYDTEYVIHRKAGEEDSPYDTLIAQGHRGIEQFQAEIHAGESVVPAQSDAVNSPQHYTQGRVEVIDIIEDAVEGADPFEAVCQANILKYTLRYRAKNGVEDLRKSAWYTSRLIEYLDAKSTQATE